MLQSLLILAVSCTLHLDAVSVANTTDNATDGVQVFEGNYTTDDIDLEDNSTDYANQTWPEDEDAEMEEGEILFEGDIEISIETLKNYYNINKTVEVELLSAHGGNKRHHMSKRAAASGGGILWGVSLWTSKVVPYVISSSFTHSQRQNILRAMQTWSDATCIRFVSRSLQYHYIKFIVSSECRSKIGRYRYYRQKIRLTTACANSHGVIMHEIGHALGLWHEQARPDRDSYVTIHLGNVIESERHNFEKKSEKDIDFQGSEYDYGSIMHYGETDFVKPSCIDNCCK